MDRSHHNEYRFIHDIVIAILEATGFPKSYFASDELDSSFFVDKPSKIAFLEKLIDLIGTFHDDVLNVKSSKIVAGLEPENTNILLIRLGQVASNKSTDHNCIIQRCIERRSITVSPKEKSEPVNVSNMALIDSNGDDDYCMKESIAKCNSDIKQTQTMLKEVISRPQCSEKLLTRPPFRFLYDVILAIDQAKNFGLRNLMSTCEYDQSHFNEKSAKIMFLQKVITLIETILGLRIDISPTKVVAGVEVEKTCLFLQLVVVASSFTKNDVSKCVLIDEPKQEIVSDERKQTNIIEDIEMTSMQEEKSQLLRTELSSEEQPAAAIVNIERINDIKERSLVIEYNHNDSLTGSDSIKRDNTENMIGIDIDPILVEPWIGTADSLPKTVQNVGQSIEFAAQSASKMGTAISYLWSIYHKMQKEKEYWTTETIRIRQELQSFVEKAQDETAPIRLSIEDLNQQINKTKRRIQLIEDEV